MSNLNLKATKAASRFLEHRGYEVLETGWKCKSSRRPSKTAWPLRKGNAPSDPAGRRAAS